VSLWCFSGHGLPRNWITADIVRIESGVLVEHWDVIEDESSEANSKSGLPMFGDKQPQAPLSPGSVAVPGEARAASTIEHAIRSQYRLRKPSL
jgi:hypothetical protein